MSNDESNNNPWPVPPEIAEHLDAPPVLSTEDPEAFNRLFDLVAKEIRPRDFIEWKMVHAAAVDFWKERRTKSYQTEAIELAGTRVSEVRAKGQHLVKQVAARAERAAAGAKCNEEWPSVSETLPVTHKFDYAEGFVNQLAQHGEMNRQIEQFRTTTTKLQRRVNNHRKEKAKLAMTQEPWLEGQSVSPSLVPTKG